MKRPKIVGQFLKKCSENCQKLALKMAKNCVKNEKISKKIPFFKKIWPKTSEINLENGQQKKTNKIMKKFQENGSKKESKNCFKKVSKMA